MDNSVNAFVKGCHNLIDPENIPADASQDSSNFVTVNGKIILVGGRTIAGDEGAVGSITALHFGYKVDGTKVFYRKAGTKIQYLKNNVWTDIISNLTESADYSFANYSSQSGAFTFIAGVDGIWKINNAFPGSPLAMYDPTKNFKGKLIINKGRSFLWDYVGNKTVLYLSCVDTQDAGVYNFVTNEAIGSLGSQDYAGTLAFYSSSVPKNCFSVVIKANVLAGLETFTDNRDGTLTSNFGGTGTINYITGAYHVTFSANTTGAVTSDYSWENSNVKGLTDFVTRSATRIATQSTWVAQTEGGDPILNVLIGQDGAYYSLKGQSSYKLTTEATDLIFTNEIFRKDIGISHWNCAISTNKGIVFINTANPTNPVMTILTKNQLTDNVEPVNIFKHFDFTKFDYSDASMTTYDRWIVVFCRKSGSSFNDTILLCSLDNNTVDIVNYEGRMGVKDGDDFYIGDPNTYTVFKVFDGYDDLNLPISNFWIGKDEAYKVNFLKKFRRLRLKGKIDSAQVSEVYLAYDGGDFDLIGTIRGDGSYVDFSGGSVGDFGVGDSMIGGDPTQAGRYFVELKLKKQPKFRTRTVKIVATGIGYFDCDSLTDFDILPFENRMPKQYRTKQNVSDDGTQTNI